MKLLFVLGICLPLCVQVSHQIPLEKKDRPPAFIRDDVGRFNFHGPRDVRAKETGIGSGIFVDTITKDDEKVLSKRGGLFKKIYKKVEEKAKNPVNYLPLLVKRDATIEKPNKGPEIIKTSEVDLGTGVHTSVKDVITDSNNESEKELQVVKRGWLKKLWKKVKNILIGGVLGMIKRSPVNDQSFQSYEDNEIDKSAASLTDDIIEVQLGTDFNVENEAEKEKVIQKVKRGWIKKIARKIKNVMKGAVVGSVIGSVIKRSNKDDEIEDRETMKVEPGKLPLLLKTLRLRPGTADQITELVEKIGGENESYDDVIIDDDKKDDGDKVGNGNDEAKDHKPDGNKLPLLLKTLRLRPGTADQITEIVETLGGDTGFQDAVIDEIIGDDKDGEENDDEEVLERNGKTVKLPKCRFVRGRFVCI